MYYLKMLLYPVIALVWWVAIRVGFVLAVIGELFLLLPTYYITIWAGYMTKSEADAIFPFVVDMVEDAFFEESDEGILLNRMLKSFPTKRYFS